MSHATTAEPPAPPMGAQGPVTKLPADSSAATGAQPLGAGGCFQLPQSDRLKRPHLPAYPALDPGRSAECEDLSTPSFYDFGPSDDWYVAGRRLQAFIVRLRCGATALLSALLVVQ